MTGDEKPYPTLSKHIVEGIIGDKLDEDLTCEEIVAELQKTYIPFFIIPDRARARRCERRWRDLFGDHVLCLEAPMDVCFVAAGAILLSEGRVSDIKELTEFLSGAGMPSARRSHVIRALTPFAEIILNIAHKPSWLSRFFNPN
jgi:hypothetical protein